jgi:hypothetical protein
MFGGEREYRDEDNWAKWTYKRCVIRLIPEPQYGPRFNQVFHHGGATTKNGYMKRRIPVDALLIDATFGSN